MRWIPNVSGLREFLPTTDVLVRLADDLSGIYPRSTRHAMLNFRSGEVLRLLGESPRVKLYRSAEITSHLGSRAEGTRVQLTVHEHSLKIYDNQQPVLHGDNSSLHCSPQLLPNRRN